MCELALVCEEPVWLHCDIPAFREAHLSVELDRQDVAGVAVVADLGPLLKVVDVHTLRHGGAHHHHQTAGEQALHDVDIWSLCWERTGNKTQRQ